MKRRLQVLLVIIVATAALLAGIAPASATQGNRSFVYSVWVDFVGRAPTANELSWYETLLNNSSISRTGVIDDAMAIETARNDYVEAVFESYIERFPTEAEQTAIDTALNSGNYLEVELIALSSADYTEFGGVSNTEFLTKLYDDVLWRSPDSSGLTYWGNQLAAGQTRKQVAQSMIRGSESAGKRVSGLVQSPCSTTVLSSFDDVKAGSYCIILDRPSDSSGASYWTTQLSTGGSQLPALWKANASSTEYYNKALVKFPSV